MAIPIPENVVAAAWDRAGGRCECGRAECGHATRPHGHQLLREHQGMDGLASGWEARLKSAVGQPVVENCEILCNDCLKAAAQFGGS